jgi:Spy/CpxP family protein refolding chaperone
MNRAKGAAVLMLVGALGAGAASGYAFKAYRDKDRLRPPPQSEVRWKSLVYERLNLDASQRLKWDSLIDVRTRAVRELYVVPRAMEDSIRAETREKQRALLTAEQLGKWDELLAEMRMRASSRQKQNDNKQQSGRNKTNTPGQDK